MGVVPNRIIKESVCTSDTIDQLSADEERFFYRLWTACDDFGRFDGRASVIMGRCFPLKVARGEITEGTMDSWLRRLEEVGLIRRYVVDGKPYLEVVTFRRHQNIRARNSRYPGPHQAS